MKCLIIEDCPIQRAGLKSLLPPHFEVTQVSSLNEFLQISHEIFELAFVDLDLENQLDGLEAITPLRKNGSYIVVLSGRRDVKAITKSYELGCFDFLSKPFSHHVLKKLITKIKTQKEKHQFQKKIQNEFYTEDPKILDQLNILSDLPFNNRAVLIKGPTGTGKTQLAKVIHTHIIGGDFIHLNCSELAESLLESELFGHTKGSFSGATENKKGKLEIANGGTLFLDEIGTISMAMQKKLLKALDEKCFYPLGSNTLVHSDFQLISATCDSLDEMVENKQFRRDFYFRIEGNNINLPPLCERPHDTKNLIERFLNKGPRRVVVTEEAMEVLLSYSWPVNIRELKKRIELLLSVSKGIIKKEQVLKILGQNKQNINLEGSFDYSEIKLLGLRPYLAKIEKEIVFSVMDENQGLVPKTLKDLKLSQSKFYRIIGKKN